MESRRNRIVSSQLIAPAVRMVAVDVWATAHNGQEDHGASFHPVVALSSVVVEDVRLDGDPGSQSVEYHAVVLDTVTGRLFPFGDLECDNSATKLVACPWPDSEDIERLSPVVEELKAMAFASVGIDHGAVCGEPR